MRIPLVLALLLAPALAQWGKDLDTGAARQMIGIVEEDLAASLAAPAPGRPALIDEFIAKHASERIEAIKRFRGPELEDLFLRLIGHDDWHVQHRALLALEYYGNPKAIERIYQLKRRDKANPFSFICSDLTNISRYAKVSNYAYRTMKRLLPGPYTFILEGSKLVPKIMLTKRKTAGIRVPDNEICLCLVRELGHPIITTSAASADGQSFHDASLIHDHFGRQVDAVLRMDFRFRDGRVAEVRFSGHGCSISQASASLLCEAIEGKSLDEVKALTRQDVLDLLGVDDLGPVRSKCAMLALKTAKAAAYGLAQWTDEEEEA